MKILFISPRYAGGIGGHANLLSQKLRQHGYDVTLMHVPHIPIKNLKNPSFAVLGTMKALLSKEKYDIVHAFNVPSAFIMKAVKAKKRVLSVHGVYSEQVDSLHSSGLSNIVTTAEPKVLKWADKLTTDSAFVKKTYKEKLNLDVELLPSPIDETRFGDIPEVTKIENQVMYIGRNSYEKGIDILRSIENKINGKVVYCTNVPWKEAMISLKSSSVLVVPSRMESIPWTIKEAFYLKVPVVATTAGGIPEIVEDKVTGILVPPNDPTSLLNAINLVLENKEMTRKLIDNAYQYYLNNLTYDKVLPKYINFYENLLKN
ncbi:MAG TPA: glycosyltransferase family 4 protein [Nitrosopumilaceae archaeon]|nr:glycosyltransferase family 4 protein [Nitrosopumilaceae archaeon]